MIKSIITAYSTRKFLAYSSAEQDIASKTSIYNIVNARYSDFKSIKVEEYSDIVKKSFSHLPEEKQALIVERLKDYRRKNQYVNKKPSIPLNQASIETQQSIIPSREENSVIVTGVRDELIENRVIQERRRNL